MTSARNDAGRDLLCFSHLRWDFVFQRPQHLLSRAARTRRVIYWEEPLWTETGPELLQTRRTAEGVLVAQPHVRWGSDPAQVQRTLLDAMIAEQRIDDPTLWYYTPQALTFTAHLAGHAVIYDCMDELSAFAGADPALPERERALMARAALVFTGGQSLFEAKRAQHPAVHAFPSGVDLAHFHPARTALPDPGPQRDVPHPRAGFYGVIDERIDLPLLAALADLRPDIHLVMVGPTAKIDLETLPRRPNIHYPGSAAYADLPAYLAHWDVALMPFAINAATRFISPTKTPEYLAAGRPVVSTPIADVVRRYGTMAGVQIAADAPGFAQAIDRALTLRAVEWQAEADAALATMSWDAIWDRMAALMAEVSARNPAAA